jgi:AraC-like DNA-binding protein
MGDMYSTEHLGVRDRFDYWHEVVCRFYAHVNGVAEAKEKFKAHTVVVDFGAAQISDVESTAIRYERRSCDIRSSPRADIFVSLMLNGEALFEQSEKQFKHRIGDILIYDEAIPYRYYFEQAYRSLLIRVPRPMMQSRCLDVDALGGVLLGANSPFGSFVGSLLRESSRVALADEVGETSAFSSPMLDMVAAAIRRGMGDEAVPSRSRRALLERIKAYMRQHLSDDTLTLERIARDQNVSVRTLCRMFAELGTTPMGWLQAQRLVAAYSALIEKKVPSVTEAALTFGFNDLSHFGRSFKKMHGRTPNSLLTQNVS